MSGRTAVRCTAATHNFDAPDRLGKMKVAAVQRTAVREVEDVVLMTETVPIATALGGNRPTSLPALLSLPVAALVCVPGVPVIGGLLGGLGLRDVQKHRLRGRRLALAAVAVAILATLLQLTAYFGGRAYLDARAEYTTVAETVAEAWQVGDVDTVRAYWSVGGDPAMPDQAPDDSAYISSATAKSVWPADWRGETWTARIWLTAPWGWHREGRWMIIRLRDDGDGPRVFDVQQRVDERPHPVDDR